MKVRKKINYLKMTDRPGPVPFSEYPRPQLVRNTKWLTLNGKWECGINVPFPLQSVLSGYDKNKDFNGTYPEEYDYHTRFEYKRSDMRALLHFGAADQICDVYIDGKFAGHHEGGYLPFTFDITDLLSDDYIHSIKVHIKDSLDLNYPYGKQSKNPKGMWYTPVSGIWQSVWIEEVPSDHIRGVKITPDQLGIRLVIDGDDKQYTVEVFEPVLGSNPATLIMKPKEPVITQKDADYTNSEDTDKTPPQETASEYGDMIYNRSGNKKVPDEIIDRKTYNGNKTFIEIKDPKTWTPDKPYLYGIRISSDTDCIVTYFAIRTVGIHSLRGYRRTFLNDGPVFFHGVLDQGYYPEGIFLPNNEEGFIKDIRSMKELGFNTLRKHIKIEPPVFYVACDVLGMIVWQDMINNSDYKFMRDTILPTFGIKAKTDYFTHSDPESRRIFEDHMIKTAEYLYNFPCICYYTIFNEGWGQFESDRLYLELKELDPTRIIDSTSGWFRQFKSDVVSKHVYFHKVAQLLHPHHPVVISEFGGYDYREKNHIFNPEGNYGYKSFKDKKALNSAMIQLYKKDIISYIRSGCCGSIYTQLSDVEDETNGIYTYDRKVCKLDSETCLEISEEIFREFARSTME